ncbi:probable pseudouridine-5'-phosphatase isoform X1 [Glossina fuscipes]|uniref:Probable pseudouridine-5'-phosphatase isoform X1 n=1 Tax=Glossina fuscipes TaxID=7396 RepID=A0A8U0WCN3_9MUSC|nr:probable pseudouridine-5'-phosphatase isoform X1 [Glossina fuscipes]
MGEKFKKVTHVIFDMDGLLLDTEIIYEEIIRQIAQEYGKTLPFEVRIKLLGTTNRRTYELAVEELKLPISVEEFGKKFEKLTFEKMTDVKMKPAGAERLMRHLHATNVPICLATSSAEDMVQLKIANHREVFNLLSHRVCASTDPEVKEGKPAPDIFLIAASRFPDKPKPQQCLVFEDSPNGVMAACKACMQVVMVPDERVSVEQSCLATLRLKSLLDFKPEMFSLPPFPN